MKEQLFYLQDARQHAYVGDGLAFHCKEGKGYATDLDKAELMTREEAISANQRRSTDIPWPQDYIDGKSHFGVDCQYLKDDDACKMVTPGCLFVYQMPNKWNGNDVYWSYSGHDVGPNFNLAINLPYPLRSDRVAWPLEYIKTKTRRIVHRQNVSIKQALRGLGITLKKEPVYKSPPVKCEHCGRFLKEQQRYDPCPNWKCGGDNRP